MNREEAAVIENYIPAAHLMVEAHEVTDTLEQAVEFCHHHAPGRWESAYLRLIWIGVNAKNNSLIQSEH